MVSAPSAGLPGLVWSHREAADMWGLQRGRVGNDRGAGTCGKWCGVIVAGKVSNQVFAADNFPDPWGFQQILQKSSNL